MFNLWSDFCRLYRQISKRQMQHQGRHLVLQQGVMENYKKLAKGWPKTF